MPHALAALERPEHEAQPEIAGRVPLGVRVGPHRPQGLGLRDDAANAQRLLDRSLHDQRESDNAPEPMLILMDIDGHEPAIALHVEDALVDARGLDVGAPKSATRASLWKPSASQATTG